LLNSVHPYLLDGTGFFDDCRKAQQPLFGVGRFLSLLFADWGFLINIFCQRPQAHALHA